MYSRIFADDWGKLEHYDPECGIISRRGIILTPGGRKDVEISIMLSPAGIETYNRGLAGIEKQKIMNHAFGDWLEVKKKDFQTYADEDKSVAFVEIKFGGRAFNFPHLIDEKIGKVSNVKVISLKNQRQIDPTSNTSWKINCWGWDPNDYNKNRQFMPMTEEEKKNYGFVKKVDYIKQKGIEHLIADVFVIAEGAGASGETIEYTLKEIFNALKESNEPLPKKVYIYVNFCSTLTVFRAKTICEENGVELDFTCMGSAIEVSREGLLPGLKYTDLSQMDKGSITYRALFEETLKTCVNFVGYPVYKRCSCGDVGESLDNEYRYYLSLIIENLCLGIPLHQDIIPNNSDGLMMYFNNPKSLMDLREIVHEIQVKYHTELTDWLSHPVLAVIGSQEEKIRKTQKPKVF